MRRIYIFIFVVVFVLFFSQTLSAKQKWEFNLHYGTWNLNILKSAVENFVTEGADTEFRNGILEKHPELIEELYQRDFNFDTGGNNLGFEIRFYPGGEYGSFSLGLSVEKTKMEFSLSGFVDMEFTDGSYVDFDADGKFVVTPLSYNLSLRWDIKPSWRVHPYVGFGFGAAPVSGDVSYNLSGKFYNAETGLLETESESESKKLKDIEELAIKFYPIIQLNLGLKGRVSENIYLQVDAGIWNGFLVRGGLSFRF
ncbi:MAG: hypothetical protein AB1410_01310 [Acidobacteriota bacterium]